MTNAQHHLTAPGINQHVLPLVSNSVQSPNFVRSLSVKVGHISDVHRDTGPH